MKKAKLTLRIKELCVLFEQLIFFSDKSWIAQKSIDLAKLYIFLTSMYSMTYIINLRKVLIEQSGGMANHFGREYPRMNAVVIGNSLIFICMKKLLMFENFVC